MIWIKLYVKFVHKRLNSCWSTLSDLMCFQKVPEQTSSFCCWELDGKLRRNSGFYLGKIWFPVRSMSFGANTSCYNFKLLCRKVAFFFVVGVLPKRTWKTRLGWEQGRGGGKLELLLRIIISFKEFWTQTLLFQCLPLFLEERCGAQHESGANICRFVYTNT